MESVKANRRDQDCVENRLLEYLTEYLNKINYSGDKSIFYGQASLISHSTIEFEEGVDGCYFLFVKEYTKDGHCITVENKRLHITLEMGEKILRTHKIKELVRQIKIKRINK